MAAKDAQLYFRDIEIAAHSIVRWTKGRQAEPVHGLFLRIAALNYQTSTRSYAEDLGIQGRYLQPVECRAILSKVPIGNWDEVDRWTPIFQNKTVTIAGEVISAEHWTMSGRRFCPACLAESAHHRTWWDLTFMVRCPFHDLDLMRNDSSGNAIGWGYPSIDTTPKGERLSRFGVPRKDEPDDGWEAYVLGRLGLTSPRLLAGLDLPDPSWPASADVFRPATLELAVDVVTLLGRLVIAGWSRSAPAVGGANAHASDVLKAGFACLSGGQPEIDRCFARIVGEAPTDAFGYKDLLGWVTDWLQADDRRRTGLVMRAIVRALRVDGRFCAAFQGMFPDIETRVATVSDVSQALSVAPNTSRRLLVQAGLLDVSRRPSRERVRRGVSDAGAVEALIDDLRQNALSKAQAAELLGVSREAVVRLLASGHLDGTNSKWSTDEDRGESVRRESVEKLLSDTFGRAAVVAQRSGMPLMDAAASVNVDVSDVVSGVLSGEIRIAGRVAGRVGLDALLATWTGVPLVHPLMIALRKPHVQNRFLDRQGGVTRMEVANTLGVPPATVAALVDVGYLKPVPGTKAGQRQPLTQESLDEVRSTLVTSAACVVEYGFDVTPSTLTFELQKAGVSDVLETARRKSGRKMTAFYRRDSVVQAMARKALVGRAGAFEAETEATRLMTDFWEGFDEFLATSRSSFRVRSSQARSVRLRTTCARWRSEVRFDELNVMRIAMVMSDHEALEGELAPRELWEGHHRDGRSLHQPPRQGEHGSTKFDVGPVASLAGKDEVLFGNFRTLLYRQMLLGLEEGRIFFEHAAKCVPGDRPFVMF